MNEPKFKTVLSHIKTRAMSIASMIQDLEFESITNEQGIDLINDIDGDIQNMQIHFGEIQEYVNWD